MFFRMFYGKLGVARMLTSQWGFARPSSIFFGLGVVRNIVPLVRVYKRHKNLSDRPQYRQPRKDNLMAKYLSEICGNKGGFSTAPRFHTP